KRRGRGGISAGRGAGCAGGHGNVRQARNHGRGDRRDRRLLPAQGIQSGGGDDRRARRRYAGARRDGGGAMNVGSPAPEIDWTNLDSEHALADAIFSELARETGDGVGITRECYSDREDAALGIFSAVAKAHGLLIDTDPAGNLVVRAPEDDGSRAAHYIGS